MELVSLSRLKEKVMTEVDSAFLREVAEGIAEIYRTAHRQLPKLVQSCPASAKDLLPHSRRAMIEALLKSMGQKYPAISSRSQPNKSKNCSHVEVKFGNILLTQSYASSKEEPIRNAVFRESLAASSWLFLPIDVVSTSLDGKYIYGILKHGCDDDLSQAGFFCLDIPLRGVLDECLRIDLTHLLGIKAAPSVPTIDIPDLAKPRPKRKTNEVITSG